MSSLITVATAPDDGLDEAETSLIHRKSEHREIDSDDTTDSPAPSPEDLFSPAWSDCSIKAAADAASEGRAGDETDSGDEANRPKEGGRTAVKEMHAELTALVKNREDCGMEALRTAIAVIIENESGFKADGEIDDTVQVGKMLEILLDAYANSTAGVFKRLAREYLIDLNAREHRDPPAVERSEGVS